MPGKNDFVPAVSGQRTTSGGKEPHSPRGWKSCAEFAMKSGLRLTGSTSVLTVPPAETYAEGPAMLISHVPCDTKVGNASEPMKKALSAVGFLFMVGALVALIFTDSLFSRAPIVIVVQIAAVFLMVWARVTFGRRSFHATADPTEGGLVTTGPYRFIRHPIYTAVCLFVVAGVLAHLSLITAGFFLVLLVGSVIRMLAEERLLRGRYPEYAQYAATTKRMVPFVF